MNLRSLFARLNLLCRQSLESAGGLCLSMTHYNVEVEHWLLKLLDASGSDFDTALKHFGVDPSRLKKDLTRCVDRLKTGNSRQPGLSPDTVLLAREAWLVASLDFGQSLTRSGHLLLALLSDETLSRLARECSDELAKISVEALRRDFTIITNSSTEEGGAGLSDAKSPNTVSPGSSASRPTSSPNLDQFTVDLTERARRGHIDPVLGRDNEVRQLVDILMRRRQNNPILTGEAGVGKTAVVEGFALRIAEGDVPEMLRNVTLRTLDLGLLQAGAGLKGEFENRLKSVIDEVKASPTPIILFIDEAHTMIGAGGQAGQNDAANLLKPALARGELRTIAATTWAEYKKYFEKDPALARRFQVVKVEEPDESTAVIMMRGIVKSLEKHHGVRVLDEGVVASVKLSMRYITGRQLPDKSVALLDTACAKVAVANGAPPPAVEDLRRQIRDLSTASDIFARESAVGTDHSERQTEISRKMESATAELTKLETQWAEERKLVSEIRDIRSRLESAAVPVPPVTPKAAPGVAPPVSLTPTEIQAHRAKLDTLTSSLRQIQGENPLLQPTVDGQAVATVVSAWTGIPVGRMVSDEIRNVLNLKDRLAERIVGQDHALDAIAKAIRTSRAGLTDPRKPVGVFLMVGTSGTGKTETAVALSELLFGGDQNMTVINMSEFKEEHKVSLLMGSPPGYVGYGEGGVLTEAVRRKPYSVVLLDEMEKAHPGVQDIFFQVFDKGNMKDGEGRDIDFKNTLIIMTSNAATDLILKLCADPETRPDPVALSESLHPELIKTFKPAFLGRCTIVPYYPLPDEVMRRIVELKLRSVARRVAENYRASFSYEPAVVSAISSRCKEVHTGGRNIDHILTRTLLPELSAEFLQRMADGKQVREVRIGIDESQGKFIYTLT